MNSRPKSQSKSRMLEDEINRLGMLLKVMGLKLIFILKFVQTKTPILTQVKLFC